MNIRYVLALFLMVLVVTGPAWAMNGGGGDDINTQLQQLKKQCDSLVSDDENGVKRIASITNFLKDRVAKIKDIVDKSTELNNTANLLKGMKLGANLVDDAVKRVQETIGYPIDASTGSGDLGGSDTSFYQAQTLPSPSPVSSTDVSTKENNPMRVTSSPDDAQKATLIAQALTEEKEEQYAKLGHLWGVGQLGSWLLTLGGMWASWNYLPSRLTCNTSMRWLVRGIGILLSCVYGLKLAGACDEKRWKYNDLMQTCNQYQKIKNRCNVAKDNNLAIETLKMDIEEKKKTLFNTSPWLFDKKDEEKANDRTGVMGLYGLVHGEVTDQGLKPATVYHLSDGKLVSEKEYSQLGSNKPGRYSIMTLDPIGLHA